MRYFKVIINETGRNSLKERAISFNQVVEKKRSVEEVESFLFDRYGKKISKRQRSKNGIFVDKKDGKFERAGFTHSFWNKDISHNSKNWFQTDWIEVYEVEEKVILLK